MIAIISMFSMCQALGIHFLGFYNDTKQHRYCLDEVLKPAQSHTYSK